MEEDLIIKKIYINDYIINTTLLQNSISKLLINILSNKFYKTNKLNQKVNNILTRIENIYVENNGEKIFNLSYQPYNQYNISSTYNEHIYNKKWIIPITNVKKTLDQNILKVQFFNYYNTNDLLLEKIDDNNYRYDGEDFNTYDADNYFLDSNTIHYKNQYVNLLGNLEHIEVPYLTTDTIYNITDSNNIINSNSNTKVIRTSVDTSYYMYSSGKVEQSKNVEKETTIKQINKSIEKTYFEVYNILKNDNINIKQFLILNPLKLLNTNYNISLGNTISYLNEIMYCTKFNIDKLINNHTNSIDDFEFLNNNLIVDYNIINKEELSNIYNDNLVYDYLNIIKNLNKYDNIYSIRILKHIYNIFGYDLNKIPNCYILYLQDILHSNINKYINKNTFLFNSILNKFKNYKSELLNNTEVTKEINDISEIYDITNIVFNKNENLFSVLYNNTHDKGLLYCLTLHSNYLKTIKQTKLNLIEKEDANTNTNCEYRIVKEYNELVDFNNDKNKFVDLIYSNNNYLVEFEDLVYNIQQETSNTFVFKNNVYNQINNKINTVNSDEVIDILNNKTYIYELLFEKIDINTNILFSKLEQFKYKNKYYFKIPYKTIVNDNIVLIKNKPYSFNNNEIKPLNITLDDLEKTIKNKCNDPNTIINTNNKNINNLYKKLNEIDLDIHKKKLLELVETLKSTNNFKNYLIRKSKSVVETSIYFKNIEKIYYTLNYSEQNIILNYLLNYNIKSIKFKNLNETELLNERNNSIFYTTYINQIKNVSNKIYDLENSEYLWDFVHHYINEYELLTDVIENNEDYSRAYYKLWEILLDNTIIDKPDFRLISLAESPGNFVKCIQSLKSNDWTDYIICTLLDDNDLTKQKNFYNRYKDYIFANPNGRLKIRNNDKFKGDLSKSSDINTFIQYVNTNNLQADLVTADGGFKKETNLDYELEEYTHLPLLFGEIITALYTQKLDGMFILKMFDIVFINSVNLLNLLSSFYKNIIITKPYNSRPCNTEKYIICSNFIGFNTSDVNKNKILDNLLSILDNLNNSNNNNNIYKYFNIFENLTENIENTNKIIELNNSIIVKTQLLHLQDVYDILRKNDSKQMQLIKTYFGPKRTHNLKLILTSEDNTDKGYFIKKIESCITLALYMKLKNQPLKDIYIEYYKLIKNMKRSVENTNIYPPHFKEIYQINSEENKSIQINKINKFVKKYCIVFEKPGVHKLLDYYILRAVEHFLLNKNIENINHNIINTIRANKTSLNSLHKYLEEICKITDIKKLFYLQDSIQISLIKNFQNTMRNYLGYYICKYTYIPIYPKYKILENVIEQVEQYGVLYNSYYICYYSGDKLDMEEFDDYMGENVFRSNNISLFEESSAKTNIITTLSNNYENSLSIEENICSFILNKYKLDINVKLDILNKLKHNKSIILDELLNNIVLNYDTLIYLINKKYEKSLNPLKEKKTKNVYSFKDKLYNYFKISEDDITKNDINMNDKIKKIIEFLNTNKDELRIDKLLNDNHILIRIIYDIYISKYFYNNYINTIIYTLVQITNTSTYTFDNIYTSYLKYEKNIIDFMYKNSNIFDIFKNNILTGYILPIKLPEISENTKLEDIFTLNSSAVNDILKSHIKVDKNFWNPHVVYKSQKNKINIEDKIKPIQDSKTILEFLINIPRRDHSSTHVKLLHLLKTNKIKNTDTIRLKLDLQNYFSKNEFLNFCELIKKDIANNHLFNKLNNIENNIYDDRVELNNKSLLLYESKISLFMPNYLPSAPLVYNSEEKYIFNCIKYLLLYVYEEEFDNYIGKKRLYDNNICLYTNKSKKTILNAIQLLSTDELKNIYKKTFNINHQIINKSNFVNKNILINSFTSLINNTIYRIDSKYIDIIYTLLKLYYETLKNELTNEENDMFKNIIMRFYNDPINNIIMFLYVYKNEFITFAKNEIKYNINIENIINNIYSNKDTILYNIIGNITNSNISTIQSKLIAEINKYRNMLNTYNIVIPYENITIKDLILISNNIKKNISYICNLSNLNTTIDLKSKYKNIKKYYSLYEYNVLIDVLKKKNYNFNLSEFDENDYDYLQVIFSDILNEFNFNFTNIYSINTNITKFVLLLKLHIIIVNCITKLNTENYTFTIDVNLKNKFNFHEGKIVQKNSESALLASDSITNNNKKYLNLFKSIIQNVTQNITDYSSILNKLNPIKYSTDESLTYDINDFNDITETYNDGLLGDIEELD
tara:strand:+ start:1595 stop:8236 length:6642 start_codon:yes stop_codon:yes gene_type:complete